MIAVCGLFQGIREGGRTMRCGDWIVNFLKALAVAVEEMAPLAREAEQKGHSQFPQRWMPSTPPPSRQQFTAAPRIRA